MTDLDTLPGGSASGAAGINRYGQVVGYSISSLAHIESREMGGMQAIGDVRDSSMPIRRDHDNDWEGDDWEEDESRWDEGGEDDDYTMPCPYCKRPIHEDAQRCPYCQRYLSDEDAPASRKPWWIIAGAMICLYVVYRWVAG